MGQTKGEHDIESSEKTRHAVETAAEGKAQKIAVYDVRGISDVTDYYVIFTGSGLNHLRALGKRIEDILAGRGIKPDHVDGKKAAGWLVFDYGDVIIHAMLAQTRHYYDIERLWGDAPRWEHKELISTIHELATERK